LSGDVAMGTTTAKIKQRAYHELKQFLVIAVYLWVVFGLLLVYKSVILNEEHISYLAHGVALINAHAKWVKGRQDRMDSLVNATRGKK
jgi:hypothetical protein